MTLSGLLQGPKVHFNILKDVFTKKTGKSRMLFFQARFRVFLIKKSNNLAPALLNYGTSRTHALILNPAVTLMQPALQRAY